MADGQLVNSKIFQNVVNYVIGPKFTGQYAIDCLHEGTGSNVIRIYRGYDPSHCNIYFDHRIRISVSHARRNAFYVFQSNDLSLPDDSEIEDYIYDVSRFLREFIRHVDKIQYCSFEQYFKYLDVIFDDCPDAWKYKVHSHGSLLFFEYSARDMDFIRCITEIMRSKAFRRSRGDYK